MVILKILLPASILVAAVIIGMMQRYEFTTHLVGSTAAVIIRFDKLQGSACTLSKAEIFDIAITPGRNTFLPKRC